MIRLDANRPATFCDGLTRRDFLHAGAIAPLGLTLPAFQRREGRRRGQGQRRELHHAVPRRRAEPARHLGPQAERPGRGPRAVHSRSRRTSPGMQISEIFPQDREARRQVLARALGLPHGDGGPRHRPPDDADRPAVHRRHRAPARRLRARLPQGRPRRAAGPRAAAASPSAAPAGNLPHGHTAGYLGKPHDPFILNADPNAPNFKVPDLLPPDYITGDPRRAAAEAPRRGGWRRRRRSRTTPRPSNSTTTSTSPTG